MTAHRSTGINMFKKAFPSLNSEFSVNISISLWLWFHRAVREVLGLQVQFSPRARWLQADNEQQVVDGSTGSAGCSGGPAVVALGGLKQVCCFHNLWIDNFLKEDKPNRHKGAILFLSSYTAALAFKKMKKKSKAHGKTQCKHGYCPLRPHCSVSLALFVSLTLGRSLPRRIESCLL